MMIIVRKQRERAELDQSRTPAQGVVPPSFGIGLLSLVNSFGESLQGHAEVYFTDGLSVP